jgi:hypothetical protein
VLAACGSGNLGKVVESQAVVPPPASMDSTGGAGAIDAGALRPTCGDGVLQTARGEQCDGADFGGLNCSRLGLGDGVLSCDSVTCQLVTTQCVRSGAPTPAIDAGTVRGDSGTTTDAGGKVDAAVTAMCPDGFTCQPSLVESSGYACAQPGEGESPLCLNPANDTTCATLLPGSTCTNTAFAAYCILACTP